MALLEISIILLVSFVGLQVRAEVIHTTKFFMLPIEPEMFNWTLQMGEEYKYHASLLKSPDLPSWMQYLYSRRHRAGFLFGVAPPNQDSLEIEIVAMNRRTYETRRRVVHLNIQEKSNRATHEVHLKIDNLNVEDLFDPYRLTKLLDIFRSKLWQQSFGDLYVTFLTSAVAQGARLPLKPSESEGVVMRLGSAAQFSNNLVELQEEVRPLWKLHYCPRDFKRTTVERLFREEGFVLDWCSFKLVESSPGVHDVDIIPVTEMDTEPIWKPLSRSLVPERSYSGEFAITILIPMLIMVVLVIMLSVILCFQHECISKQKEEEPIDKMTQYTAVQRATSTLRSLSRPRDDSLDASLAVSFPALDEDATRPNPPPYCGTMRACQSEF